MAKKKNKNKKKSGPGLKKLSNRLVNKEYAGSIKTLKDLLKSNDQQYANYVGERKKDFEKERKSNIRSFRITKNVIEGQRSNALDLFQRNASGQEAISEARRAASTAANNNALTNFESMLKARGIDPGTLEGMKADFQTQRGYSDTLDSIRNASEGSAEQRAMALYDILQEQARGSVNNAQALARRAKTDDLKSVGEEYTNRANQAISELASTKLEKGNAKTQTYLTLKRDYQQSKAEAQQRRLEIAMQKSKQAADDYWKAQTARLNEGKFNLSRRELDLKEQNSLHQWEMDLKKQNLSLRKQLADEKIAGLSKNAGPSTRTPFLTGSYRPDKFYDPKYKDPKFLP